MSTFVNLRRELKSKADLKKAKLLQGFFKTNKGEYGEGDVFLGITVPETRKIAHKYNTPGFKDLESLLKSKIHEERLAGLLILVHKCQKAGEADKPSFATPSQKLRSASKASEGKGKIFNFYLKNAKRVNNWDLVDLSAPKIVGDYLLDKNRQILYKLAKSKNIWEKRISILATFAFIKEGQFADSLKIAEMLLKDKHDLIHKALGWMLREVGKKSQPTLERFLDKYASKMPRTMLRYAIERLPEGKRKKYLRK